MDQIFEYIQELHTVLDDLPTKDIAEVIEIIHEARFREKTIFVMGNGGSSSTASHFVCDLSKNTRAENWPHFRVIGLTDNMASITAYANDEGYENVFSQQLVGLLRPGDIVLAISASGNSANILKAVELANSMSAYTIGMTGCGGGRLAHLARKNIHVPTDRIEQVEDIHLIIEHMIVSSVREAARPIPINNDLEIIVGSAKSQVNGEQDPVLDHNSIQGKEKLSKALELFYSSNRDMLSPNEQIDVLTQVLQSLVNGLAATSGSLLVLDEAGQVRDGLMAYGGDILAKTPHQLSDILLQGLAGWVLRNNQPALVSSTKDDPRWFPRSWEELSDIPRSAISLPLVDQNRVIGVLTLVRPSTRQFTREELTQLTAIAIIFSLRDYAK